MQRWVPCALALVMLGGCYKSITWGPDAAAPDAAPDAAEPDDTEAVFALRGLALQRRATVGDGLDLDAIVTNEGLGISLACTLAPYNARVDHTERDARIDNEWVAAPSYNPHFPSSPDVPVDQVDDDVCCYAQHGRGTLLLRLSEWNGTRNDAHVVAALIAAVDGTTADPARIAWSDGPEHGLVETSTGAPANPPSWDSDATHWYVKRVVDADGGTVASNQRDPDASIADGWLRMSLTTDPITLYRGKSASVPITLQLGRLVVRLSDDLTRLESGDLVGILDDRAFGALVRGVHDACLLGVLATTTVHFADVRAPNAPVDSGDVCTGVSFGTSFTGVRGRDVLEVEHGLCAIESPCFGSDACGGDDYPIEATICADGHDTTRCDLAAWR